MKKFLITSALALCLCLPQGFAANPKREFRGAWLHTVHQSQYAKMTPAETQKYLRDQLDKLQAAGCNAILFQVRPSADAFYPSELEPWSRFLSGTAGKAPSPTWDPLQFMIDESHARGMELHAWLNPYRVTTSKNEKLPSNHIYHKHPERFVTYDGKLYFDPGLQENREFIEAVVKDIITRYDVDAIHMDDYFYPYPTPGRTWSPASFGDGKSPSQRRGYIDDFVQDMYKSVKSSKPWVRVGISPFGIWRPGVPGGIEAGVDAYEHLACDARKWLSRGWVDYLAPQLYWRCSPAKQSFPALMQWWAAQNSRRPVWPGIATARIMSSEDPGRPASEIAAQVNYSRSLARTAPGQCFWSIKSIMRNAGGIQKYLNRLYPSMAVPPAMPWCGTGTPGQPQNFYVADNGSTVTLSWQPSGNPSRKWAVQARYGSQWATRILLPGSQTRVTLPKSFLGDAGSVAVRGVSAYGAQGPAAAARR